MSDFFTTRQVGEIAGPYRGLPRHPDWLIRRTVDSLADVPRFAGKRLIPRQLLPAILTRLSDKRAASDAEAKS